MLLSNIISLRTKAIAKVRVVALCILESKRATAISITIFKETMTIERVIQKI